MVLSIGPTKNSKCSFNSKICFPVHSTDWQKWGSCPEGPGLLGCDAALLGEGCSSCTAWPLVTKALHFFRMLGTIHPLMQCHISEACNWQLHKCENIRPDRMCFCPYHTDTGTAALCFHYWVHLEVTALLMWFCLFVTNCVVKCKLWQYLKMYVVEVKSVSQHMKDRSYAKNICSDLAGMWKVTPEVFLLSSCNFCGIFSLRMCVWRWGHNLL
jgi:hypothetical protein